MRLVLDTNVVLSALLWLGTPHRLLSVASSHPDVTLCSSPELVAELTDVISREWARKRLALIGKAALAVVSDYLEVIELAEPAALVRVVSGDADDDHVLAAAVGARADLIVSGDRKHLLPLRQFDGIPIVDAAEALVLILDRSVMP